MAIKRTGVDPPSLKTLQIKRTKSGAFFLTWILRIEYNRYTNTGVYLILVQYHKRNTAV